MYFSIINLVSVDEHVKLLIIIEKASSLPLRVVTYPEYDFTLRIVPLLPLALLTALVPAHIPAIVPFPPHIVRLSLKDL